MMIRQATPTDFESILSLNDVEVEYTSPMDLARIQSLDTLASYHKVAVIDGAVMGFLIAFDHSVQFENDNFKWFADRYDTFVYIDRIVISENAKGQGVGRALYEDLFSQATEQKIEVVGCEFNLIPLNEASAAYHQKMGFHQVGTREYEESGKVVAMQIKPLLA
jgi:predicted GNAT superfamily acetyltransferase